MFAKFVYFVFILLKISSFAERNADKLKEILVDWLFLLFLGVACAFINIFIEMLIFNLQESKLLSSSSSFTWG